MLKRKMFVVLFLVLGMLGFFWAIREQNRNRLTIENRSGQPLEYLEITIAGETNFFRNLADGGDESVAFKIKTNDRFVVAGRLADGTEVGGIYSYTTGAAGERARLVVKPLGMIDFVLSDKGPSF